MRDTLRPDPLPALRSKRLCIDLGRGDYLLALLDQVKARPPLGLAIVLHGLSGCSEGPGLLRLAHVLLDAGFHVFRLNLRGAGAGRNLARGHYAASCNRDLLPALAKARQLAGSLPAVGVGLSLGGTMLLNALTKSETSDQPLLDGLVCISSPLDLALSADAINAWRNRSYQRWLLNRLRQQCLADPYGVSDMERQWLEGPGQVRTIRQFDSIIVAPRWGFDSVETYYHIASPLDRIQQGALSCPTLLLHASDDPWVPVGPTQSLYDLRRQDLQVQITRGGGHNGFHGSWPSRTEACPGSWGDLYASRWLARLVRSLNL